MGNTQERDYRHEMGGEVVHRLLTEVLPACRATVVISGYGNPLFGEELCRGWHRHGAGAGPSSSQPVRT